MTDLSDLYADDPMRASFSKKKSKAQEKLDKIMSTANAKAAPLQAEIAMYDKMIAAIDERNATFPAAADQSDEGREATLSITEQADGSATLAIVTREDLINAE